MALDALPDGWEDETSGTIRVWARSDLVGVLRSAGRDVFGRPEKWGGTVGLLDRGRSPGPIVEVAGFASPLLVRRDRRGGVLGRLLPPWRTCSRARAEALVVDRLVRLGVDVAPLVAVRLERVHPLVPLFRVESLVEYWPDAVDLELALRRTADARARRRIAFRAGSLVRRLHDAGVSHPDLNVRNLLVRGDGRLALVDFSGAHPGRPPGPGRRRRDLLRLARSAWKRGLLGPRAGLREALAFLRGYDPGRRRAWWRTLAPALRRRALLHGYAWRAAGPAAGS